jgi:sugar phosphate isomerase/epimerase
MQVGLRHSVADDMDGVFGQVREIGAKGLEIVYPRNEHLDLLGNPGHSKELASLAESYGVTVPSLNMRFLCESPSLIAPPDTSAEAQGRIRDAIATAAAVGAPHVVVPFLSQNAIQVEDDLNNAAEALEGLVDHAASANVVLAIESTLNIQQQQQLLNRLGDGPEIKISVNTAATITRKFDVATVLRDLGRNAVAHVHFQDVRLRVGLPPDYDVTLGEGDVDFRAATLSLRALGYTGWIILQPPDHDDISGGKTDLAFARGILGT